MVCSKSSIYLSSRWRATAMIATKSCLILPLFLLALSAAAEDKKMTHTYKQVGDLKILADVYPAAGEKRPVVVWIHGGALINGHRESVPGWLVEACRTNAYVLVSIDYRLAPETQLPLIIEDVENAFRWIRKQG